MQAAVMKVKSSTVVPKLASAVFRKLKEEKEVHLLALGAGAVNQAVKALARANSFAAAEGYSLKITPGFTTLEVTEGDHMVEKTGIKLRVKLL